MAIAMSVLVHGEAVRFNRGRSSREDFDFKCLRDRENRVYPYVSSQSYKKHWREALSTAPSPIHRGSSSGGSGKNQAYTDGNPIVYADDDLFGYMVAGAEDLSDGNVADGTETEADESLLDPKIAAMLFTADDLKDVEGIARRLRANDDELSRFINRRVSPEAREALDAVGEGRALSINVRLAIIEALNDCLQEPGLYAEARFPKLKPNQKKVLEAKDPDITKIIEVNRELLQGAFKKELADGKRATTRRTAPIRMHALVAFSGIKTAKDWQIFARDVERTGLDAVINPNIVGIYSGWLKTRIIIETERVGKFYVGRNMDILEGQRGDLEVRKEINPYSPRQQDQASYVMLTEEQRLGRVRDAIRALADIGNNRGPASGALHDGSLRPKAFIAAHMKCADSPFDSVWEGTSGLPRLNLPRLRAVLDDWDDLFASRDLYIGLPIENLPSEEGEAESLRQNIESELKGSGFTPHIGTPRKMLMELSKGAVL